MKFSVLADFFSKLESTSKRLQMTDYLVELFKKSDKKVIDKVIYLLLGGVGPSFSDKELGLGVSLVEQAIANATGYDMKHVDSLFKKTGDLGVVAEKLVNEKKQKSLYSEPLTVEHVFDSLVKISEVEGSGSQVLKIRVLSELLGNASGLEARFIVRIVLGELRLGVSAPTILDALSVYAGGDKSLRPVFEKAFNVSSDLGLVAKLFFTGGLDAVRDLKMAPGNPVLPALCERLPTAEEIIKRFGRCAVEHKYDGMRVLVHKKGNEVKVFSRRQTDLTSMFPEIVSAVKKLPFDSLILDGEVLSFNEVTGEYLPFQGTVQRKRKYGIDKLKKEFPVHVFFFDILFKDGEDLTGLPFIKRRKILEKAVPNKGVLRLAKEIITDSVDELQKFFDEAVEKGLEGVVVKDLNAPYTVGARKFAWVKLKRSYAGGLEDSVDLAVVGFYRGKGKRVGFGFGGFLGCVYDKNKEKFVTIARVGSGFSEEDLRFFYEKLTELKIKEKSKLVDSLIEPDFWVEPKLVVEVIADEITRSPVHTCGRDKQGVGFALRFPRFVKLREDKSVFDVTTVDEIKSMFKNQKRSKVEEGN